MLKRQVAELISETDSYYSLVVAVAKRAREIAAQAEQSRTVLTEKPVRLAVQDIYTGRTKVSKR